MIRIDDESTLEVDLIKIGFSVGMQPDHKDAVLLNMVQAVLEKLDGVESVESTNKVGVARPLLIVKLTSHMSINEATAFSLKLQKICEHCLKIEL